MRSNSKQPFCVPMALLALGAHCAYAAPAFNDPADVAAIAAIEQALATQTDMKALIGYYAPDAFVVDMIAPGIYKGRTQIENSFAEQFAPVKSMKGAILDINVASDGNLACAAVRAGFDTQMKDGSSLKLSTRQLDAFKKSGGKWQIVQEHISVPLDDKTGMAMMDADLPVKGPIAWTDDMVPSSGTSTAKADAEIRHWLVTGAPVIDINEMVTYFGPGDEALLYDLTAPGEYRGMKEIHDAYAPLMDSLSGAKDQLLTFVVDSDGKFGVQIDTQNLQIKFKDGTTKVISFRQSDCMHRVDGKWKTFFEMLSFPFDAKTGKSITLDPKASFK